MTAAARDLIAQAMETEAEQGILRCLYCGADNGRNDPPEDDAIRHAADCEGQAAIAAMQEE